jgi:hypothetical protein
MQAITTIGLDIAKSVFQVHGVDANGPSGYPSSVEASVRQRSSSIAPITSHFHRAGLTRYDALS